MKLSKTIHKKVKIFKLNTRVNTKETSFVVQKKEIIIDTLIPEAPFKHLNTHTPKVYTENRVINVEWLENEKNTLNYENLAGV